MYIFFYNSLLIFLLILLSPVLAALVAGSKKYRNSFRRKISSKHLKFLRYNSDNERIWIHALSVGEVFSVEKLVQRISVGKTKPSIIFTVSTRTGYDVAKKYVGSYVKHVDYMPYDIPWVVNRFIKLISPDKIIFIETDLWPNMTFFIKRLGIPFYFVNAKMSDKAYKKASLFVSFLADMFLSLDKVCVQSASDRKRFLNLGLNKDKLLVSGNTKFDQDSVLTNLNQTYRIGYKLGLNTSNRRPVLIAGSTHSGEEEIFLILLRELIHLNIRSTLILAPRNHERKSEIHKIFSSSKMQLTVEMLSDLLNNNDNACSDLDVIIVDKMGILKDLYPLSDLVFVGGSMVNQGGHNMIEPAFFSKPILFGPYVDDFKYIAKALERSGGGIRVKNTKELIWEIASLLFEKDKAKKMGNKAASFCKMHKGATGKIMNFLEIS